MKRHVERRIGLARCFQHQTDRAVHAVEIDAEVRKPVFKADGKHAMRALADGAGIQQRQGGRRLRIY
jgi:hypothetical protein